MKKIFFLFLSLVSISIIAVEPYIILKGNQSKNYNSYGNTLLKNVEKQNMSAIEVTFGGVAEAKSGAMQIKTSGTMQNDYNSLVITYSGDGNTGNFILIVADSDSNKWCWNASKRWLPEAMIPCHNEDIVRKVFNVRDFKYMGKPTGEMPVLNLNKIRNIQLSIGMELKDPKVAFAKFLIYEVALEKDAKESVIKENIEVNTEQ